MTLEQLALFPLRARKIHFMFDAELLGDLGKPADFITRTLLPTLWCFDVSCTTDGLGRVALEGSRTSSSFDGFTVA